MGSLCSKPGTHSEDGATLRPNFGRSAKAPAGQRLGQSVNEQPNDPRTAAAQAAEERLKAAKKRGVVTSNPNSGRLAAQLEANKSAPRVPEQRQEERLVWD